MNREKTVRSACREVTLHIWGDTFSIHSTRHGVSSANCRCMSMHRWRKFPIIAMTNGSCWALRSLLDVEVADADEVHPDRRVVGHREALQRTALAVLRK